MSNNPTTTTNPTATTGAPRSVALTMPTQSPATSASRRSRPRSGNQVRPSTPTQSPGVVTMATRVGALEQQFKTFGEQLAQLAAQVTALTTQDPQNRKVVGRVAQMVGDVRTLSKRVSQLERNGEQSQTVSESAPDNIAQNTYPTLLPLESDSLAVACEPIMSPLAE